MSVAHEGNLKRGRNNDGIEKDSGEKGNQARHVEVDEAYPSEPPEAPVVLAPAPLQEILRGPEIRRATESKN